MYENIYDQIRFEAEKRNLRDTTISAYCRSVEYFIRTTGKDISALNIDDVVLINFLKRVP